MTEFEKFKCPTEVKSAVLKACGLHGKDLIGSGAYLTTVVPPIRLPSEDDLDNYVGWNLALTEAVREMEESQKEDRAEIQQRRIRCTRDADGYSAEAAFHSSITGNT